MDTSKVYGIQYKDGGYTKLAGKTIQEAYSQNGKKTPEGNIDFSIMDFYFLVPIPMNQGIVGELEPRYQLFVVEEKGKDAEEDGKATNNLEALQKLLERRVKFEKKISAWILDLYVDKVVSWLWI
jgi:hypothetical protein